MTPTGLEYLVQFGGLGLAAYLIWWLTRKLNGKLDRLVEAVQSSASETHRLADAMKTQTETLERHRREDFTRSRHGS